MTRSSSTLSLLEPALTVAPSAPPGTDTASSFTTTALGQYRAGDKSAAIHTFLRGVAGPDYRAVVDRVLPGAFEHSATDADTFFAQELPALQRWSFGLDDARLIRQPVLAEPFVLPRATHLLYLQSPREMAERLAAFFARHPPRGEARQ